MLAEPIKIFLSDVDFNVFTSMAAIFERGNKQYLISSYDQERTLDERRRGKFLQPPFLICKCVVFCQV